MGGGISRSPVARRLRKVRPMPKDVGYWIVMGALLLALVVFLVGWMRQRSLVSRELAPDGLADVVVPPSLSGPATSGWWRVSSSIYSWYDLLLMAFVAGIYLSGMFLELFIGKQEIPKMSFGLAVATMVMQFFMVALVTGFVAWRLKPERWLGLRWPLWPLGIPIAIIGVLFTWGVMGVMQMTGFFEWLQDLLGGDGQQEVVKAFTENDDPVMLGAMVLLAVVVAPLTEEILFRGYIYPVAKRFAGRWAALIFSALVFAVVHQNAQILIPLFVLGVLLTLAYEFTGSIWAPMGMHALFNGATVSIQLAIKYGLVEAPTP
ncbi:CPBP family intramembrane glutamic endopeptidase [Haloferula sp.]|uniref:CPBP family intramembrane glutamic endopeptidase n=1 Tax=Haloferula sp. TaxID=2497595 RepID=UPI00329C8715